MTREKVLFLGPGDSPLIDWLRAAGETVGATADRVSAADVAGRGFAFLISRVGSRDRTASGDGPETGDRGVASGNAAARWRDPAMHAPGP